MRLKIYRLNIELQNILFYLKDHFNDNITIIINDSDPYDYEMIFLEKMTDIDTTKLYISCFESDFNVKNIFSLYYHLNILDTTLEKNNSEPIICFLAYIIHNFLLLSTDLTTKFPVILDPISSITYLLNTNKSLARFGDGEINASNGAAPPHGENSIVINFKNEFNQILKNENDKLFVGLCDIFYPACKPFWNENEYKWWFLGRGQWPDRFIKKLSSPDKKIFLNANISRIRHYPIIKVNKYFEHYAKLFLNKNIVVVCNGNGEYLFYDHIRS
jgi:hypothetical protein